MPITFNSQGGFLNGTISSSNGDIFVTTSGSVGAINIGQQLQVTGSQIIEKDTSGVVRNKKTFNTDGSITQEKFDASGKIAETNIKNPSTGKETARSGSATSNQIEFQQNSSGAFITVSGSIPGYNIVKTGATNDYRVIRQTKDFFYTNNNAIFTIGVDGVNDKTWFVNPSSAEYADSNSALRVSASGDVFVKGNIHAQEFHTELISSSIVFQSGSTIFGNSSDDTHQFTGKFVNAITASGDISSSGTIIANSASLSGKIDITGRSKFGTTDTSQASHHFKGISGDTNFFLIFDKDGEEIMKGEGAVGDSNLKFTFGDNGAAGNGTFYQVDDNNSFHILRNDANNSKVGINTAAPTKELTVKGDISASGEYLGNQIQIYQANFSDDIGTTTHYIPLGTSTFEQTTEDDDAVGLVAPYDGELVKIIYRHSFDASSTTTRWLMTIIADGTDMAGTATNRFRGTVTGASTDTIKEITVADADGGVDDMTFSKGETVFISIRNSADVTTNTVTDEFHVTVVLKFKIPSGLI